EAPVAAGEAARAFNRQGVFKRLLIVAAGPAFNFLFAIAVYAGLYMVGLPEARPAGRTVREAWGGGGGGLGARGGGPADRHLAGVALARAAGRTAARAAG